MFCRYAEPAAPGLPGYAFSDAEWTFGRSELIGTDPIRDAVELVLDGAGIERCHALRQIHSAEVVTVDRAELSRYGRYGYLGSSAPESSIPLRAADALVTDLPGVALLIRTADCLPVVFTDAEAGVVGVAHAGRVGLAAGVLVATVAAMRDLGAARIRAVIGPAICGDCYEVPAQMREEVSTQVPGSAATTSWGTPSLDLPKGAAQQLDRLGVQVEDLELCTRTDPGLHSYRRDGAASGRLGSFVWIAPRVGSGIPGSDSARR
ncbi:polyphenol oxidase family protein [Naumannella halotolerans]|uniref:Purine nucleoside phosphorylase n=1 Tax=Naumannella halotolerans TaxID=993414 RepID=A0A4R7J8G6_9ACTN|nr:polyphenol oxidase family protein [Naumannella halotolerans]TDT32817.1 hypothetical protein CLV29_0406 [Naumannella halotolerans]